MPNQSSSHAAPPPLPLSHSEFVELLRRAIALYIDCEDYPEDAKLTDLRAGELALFIPTELPMERLGIPWPKEP